MSDDENKPQPPSPLPASAETAATSAVAKPAEKPAPPPPEPGFFGQALSSKGYATSPLGNDAAGMEMLRLTATTLIDISRDLRDQYGFDFLVSVSGVDLKTHREAVYHLYSTSTYKTLVLKVEAVNDMLPSLMGIWPAIDWHERETFDLLGITFDGHPNLTRILMPDDWVGYPLRKDYKEEDPRLIWNRR